MDSLRFIRAEFGRSDVVTAVSEAIEALQVFKNVILEGPPGTGKSYSVAGVADKWPRPLGDNAAGEQANGSGPWAVTFHPSTSYEEFVEGIRYNPEPADPNDPQKKPKGFELRSGVFRHWIDAARAEPDKDFLVLIDEVNRANVAKVLGDLLLGLEASKRLRHNPACTRTDGVHVDCWSGGVTTQLLYSNDLLGVPENLYVLGTMNSSDRSIAPLDSALRRRFAFVRVPPLSGDDLKSQLAENLPDVGTEVIARSVGALDKLNEALEAALGPNSTLGHSYLFELDSTPGAPLYWMEVDKSAVQTGSQLQVTREWADRLLTSAGAGSRLDAKGSSVELVVDYDGSTYKNVRLEYPHHGNVRFSANSSRIPFQTMNNGVTFWMPVDRKKVRLEYVPFSDNKALNLDLYWARSDWRAGSQTRKYGRFGSNDDARGGDRERTVWRYSILPQLLDNLTQAFAPELLIAGSREIWLRENLTADVGEVVLENLRAFDEFLNGHLGLQILLAGHGLSSGLLVGEAATLPVETALLTENSDGANDSGHDA